MEGFGGLLTVFDLIVECISGKDKCKPTLLVLPMDEMKMSYFYHGGLTECEWISLTTFLLCFGLHPYDAIMNTVG